jgi:hypothetical protein
LNGSITTSILSSNPALVQLTRVVDPHTILCPESYITGPPGM